ncbi:integrase core domain [Brachionus plicatilis]|uniref:Integrase core domain n=1 Tax=Brachionus plicatilis TaxID=10195 RepID=A0A3M7RNM1_BRAPC|nr:integrase core domain [Brachionus plicatilis]
MVIDNSSDSIMIDREPNENYVDSCGVKEVVFTPQTEDNGVYWSHCLSKSDDKGVIFVQVLNLNESLVEIKVNDYVGFTSENFEIVDENNLIEVNSTPGVKNVTADLLSRPETEGKSVDVNACGLVFKQTVNWLEEQKSDQLVGKISELVSNGKFTDENIMEFMSKEKFCSFLIKNKENFCIKNNVVKAFSSLYHQAGYGLVERLIKTIKQIITMYINTQHNNWDDILQASISAYNSSKQSSTKYSPYEVLFGKAPVLLTDVILNSLTERNECVRQNLEIARDRQKKSYDKFVRDNLVFEEGDLVLLINSRNKPGESKSLKQRAIGPFKIVKALGELNYSVMNLVDKKMQTVYYYRLLKFKHRDSNGSETLSLRQKESFDSNGHFNSSISHSVNQEVSSNKEVACFDLNFILSSNLVSNIDTYQIEATFMCTVCNRSFETISGLKRHKTRLNHREQVLDQSVVTLVQNEINNNEQIRTDQNRAVESGKVNDEETTAGLEYTDAQSTDEEIEQGVDGQCNTCSRSFKGQKGLSQHLRMSSCGQAVTMFS